MVFFFDEASAVKIAMQGRLTKQWHCYEVKVFLTFKSEDLPKYRDDMMQDPHPHPHPNTLFLSHHLKCDRMQILPLPPHALPTRAQIESTYSTPKQKSSCQSSHNLTISPRFLEGACFEPQINGATYTFSLRIKGNQSQKLVYILCTVTSCILLVCVRTRQHAFYVQFY